MWNFNKQDFPKYLKLLKLINEVCKYGESQVLLNISILLINQTKYSYTFKVTSLKSVTILNLES